MWRSKALSKRKEGVWTVQRTEIFNLVVPFLSAFQIKMALCSLQLLAHHRCGSGDHLLLVRRLGALGSCVGLRSDRPRAAMGNCRGLAGESSRVSPRKRNAWRAKRLTTQ